MIALLYEPKSMYPPQVHKLMEDLIPVLEGETWDLWAVHYMYNSVDHLYEGGNLQRVPMPMRRSLTVLNSIRDITMNVGGEIFDNAGQLSPRSILRGNDDEHASRDGISDNVFNDLPGLPHLVLMMCIWLGARSLIWPRSTPCDYDDVYASPVEVIDNISQQSPRSLQSKVDEIRVFRGKIIDNVGWIMYWNLS